MKSGDCCWLSGETHLSKQGFVGGFNLLPLGVAARSQQLQDGILVRPYGDRKSHVNTRIPVSHTDCVTLILDDDDHFPR